MATNNNYTVLHLHTELSLLDSCTNHKLYADKAVELGQSAICYTEHGNCFNWIEKKMYANKVGLKYIHGVEIYLTEKIDKDDEGNLVKIRDNYHTILIARNYAGVKEINKLIDLASQPDHFYYNPRITFEEFKNISNNVIKISACLASPLNKIRDESLIQYYDYLEIQPHNDKTQAEYNCWLYEMSKKYNKPLSVGTDTHSIDQYKAECRTILQIAKDKRYPDEDKLDLTYKTYDELVDMFERQNTLPLEVVLEAINNTNIIADSVEDFELDLSFKYPKLYDNEEEVLKARINRMYADKVKRGIIKADPIYAQMVQEEMRVFKKIGMVGFMLFMSELICWCWENNIPVGFCRGSCGGSMIAYLTDIIDVNPVQWHTIFSRFANESRVELGDIDVDISPSQRQLVYDHIIEEFGEDNTAYILTIGTVADKGTIDEIGRALSELWAENTEEYKEIANKFDVENSQATYKEKRKYMKSVVEKLKKAPDNPYSLNNIANIKKEYDQNPEKTKSKYPDVFYYFEGLRGTAISQGIHPAGIIVSPTTLPDNYGTFWNDGKRVMSINMEEAHEVSLNKYDILGLKNVEIIKDTCELANIPYPKSHEINWNDKDVWEHITDSPVGIFQFEGDYAFSLLDRYQPRCINDLSLVNASLRPSGESYRDRLIAREANHNPSELIDDLLAPNNGWLVFQEDTIKFLQEICGLSGSDADNIRRAIGRKQKDRLDAAMPQILEGYCKMSNKPRDVAENEAREFLQIIEDSANYQFGFNHSTGYSMIGYTCGYLRHYYPLEFVTAYLNNANNDKDIKCGTELAGQLNINIKPIKFRKSKANYMIDKENGEIYKGIGSIKHLNEKISYELYDLKDNQYNNFFELLKDVHDKTSVNSKQLTILIKLNFFSEFGNPNQLLEQVNIYDQYAGKKNMSKSKLTDEQIEVLSQYAIKVTEKTIKLDPDKDIAVMQAFNNTSNIKTTVKERIAYENELLGMPQITIPKLGSDYYLVNSIDGKYRNKFVKLYRLQDGENISVKVKGAVLDKQSLEEGAIIKVITMEEEHKSIKTSEGWRQSDETETILKRWVEVQ